MSFGFMGLLGLNQAFLPLAGFNYGASRFDRLRQTILVTVRAGSVFSLFIAAVGPLFRLGSRGYSAATRR